MKKKKEIKKEKIETPQLVWKSLEREYSKIFDNFKYFDEPNRILFLNILIGESIKFSNISPLNCLGLLGQIQDDINHFVRTNLSIALNTPKPSYLG